MAGIESRWRRLLAAGIAPMIIASCEKPFNPTETEAVFTIYGLLEGTTQAGQRQWVRVMPVRSGLATPPGPIDAVVTLEELGTGVREILTDSIVQYPSPNVSLYGHNFSTTMHLVPGRRYRLTATRSDGAQSSATVLIPVVTNPALADGPGGSTRVEGMSHLAIAYRILICLTGGSFRDFLPILEYDGQPRFGSWGNTRPPVVPLPPSLCSTTPAAWLIVASGEPWPWRVDGTAPPPGHPRAYSNVEGGLGFLGGVRGVLCEAGDDSCRVVQLFDGSLPW